MTCRIKVACMDRRLNPYLDVHQDGKTITYRTAGGNLALIISEVHELAKAHDATEIIVYTHTDCGFAKVVYAALSGEKVDDAIYKDLVVPFLKNGLKNRGLEGIEKENAEMQGRTLAEMEGCRRLYHRECRLVGIETINPPQLKGERSLVVGLPTKRKFEDIANIIGVESGNTYFLNANRIDGILTDIRIAVENLNIKDVRLFQDGDSQCKAIDRFGKAIHDTGILGQNANIPVIRV
jgi:hypothetical protein